MFGSLAGSMPGGMNGILTGGPPGGGGGAPGDGAPSSPAGDPGGAPSGGISGGKGSIRGPSEGGRGGSPASRGGGEGCIGWADLAGLVALMASAFAAASAVAFERASRLDRAVSATFEERLSDFEERFSGSSCAIAASSSSSLSSNLELGDHSHVTSAVVGWEEVLQKQTRVLSLYVARVQQ